MINLIVLGIKRMKQILLIYKHNENTDGPIEISLLIYKLDDLKQITPLRRGI